MGYVRATARVARRRPARGRLVAERFVQRDSRFRVGLYRARRVRERQRQTGDDSMGRPERTRRRLSLGARQGTRHRRRGGRAGRRRLRRAASSGSFLWPSPIRLRIEAGRRRENLGDVRGADPPAGQGTRVRSFIYLICLEAVEEAGRVRVNNPEGQYPHRTPRVDEPDDLFNSGGCERVD